MTAVVCFTGRANAGKTTLLEIVIPELRRRGYSVAAVKHSAHAHQLDQPGKNSYRLAEAGAGAVLMVTPEQTAEYQRTPRPLTLEEIAARYAAYDVLLVEGFNGSPYPHVEVLRSETGGATPRSPEEHRIAVVSDVPIDAGCPRFDFPQVDALINLIDETVITPSR